MFIICLILNLILVLLIIFLIIFVIYWRNYWHYHRIPHDKPQHFQHIWKTLRKYNTQTQIEDENLYFQKLYKKFKGSTPFCGFYRLLDPRVMVLEHDLLEQILEKDFGNFNDRGYFHNIKCDSLSANLYNLDGNVWQEMRLKLDNICCKEVVENLYNSLAKICRSIINKMETQRVESSTFINLDIKPLLYKYILNNIAQLIYGLDETLLQQKYSIETFTNHVQKALNQKRHNNYLITLMERFPKFFRTLNFATTPRETCDYFLNLLKDVIQQREKTGLYKEDYLQLLLQIMTQELSTRESSRYRNLEELNSELFNELQAHAFTFIRGGLEPTVNTLYWVLQELAKNPAIQEKVRSEMEQIYQESNNTWNYENLRKVNYLNVIIKETLRLHPITPYIIRRTLNDFYSTKQSEYVIPRNTYVIIPFHALHHDPTYYTQPDIFNPDRFMNKNGNRPCFCLGFGIGPRQCLGYHFAQLQMYVFLINVLMKYNISLATDQNQSEDNAVLKISVLNSEPIQYIELNDGTESSIVI